MSVEGKFLSKEINDLFWREGLTLVTAESCTAGSVAAAITAVAGSSHFFKRWNYRLFQRNKGKSVGGKPRNFRNSWGCK